MMKRIFAFCLCALALLSCAQKGPKRPLVIRADENTAADFGKIMEIDGPVQATVLVRNEFSDTLYPKQVVTPCGCTAVDFDRKPVAPGEDMSFVVGYNPNYRPGPMREVIQVIYGFRGGELVSEYAITGNVIGYSHPIEEDRPYNMGGGLYTSHKVLMMGGLEPGESGRMFFRYGNGLKKSARLGFDIPEEYRPYVKLRQPGKLKADFRDTLHIRFTMPLDKQPGDTLSVVIQPLMNGKPTSGTIRIKAKTL